MTVIGISDDSPEELASWAADADFPVLLAHDKAHAVAQAYGLGLRSSGNIASRSVIVVGPDGRVAWTALQFRGIDPSAYEELGAEVARVAPALDEGVEDLPQGMDDGFDGERLEGIELPDC